MFENFAVIDNCCFNLIEVEVILQPFLLGMKTNLISPRSHQRLDLAQLHG